MKKTYLLPIAVCSLLSAPSALAEIRFNGFGSFYLGITTDDDETLYGYDDDISSKPNSLFGLQATADLMDGLTATAQIVARGADDYDAEFEWAYLTYAVNDQLSVSAGRLRIPFFKYSEYLDVGYAFPWARTPRDVYGINFNNMEGFRANYNTNFGYWDVELQAIYGVIDEDIEFNGFILPTEAEDLMGASINVTRDWFSFRLGYSTADMTLATSIDAFEPFFASFNRLDIFNDIQTKDDHGYFGNIGFFIDYEDWVVNTEYVNYGIRGSFGEDTSAYYAMVGRRFGEMMISYTYSENERNNDYDVADSIPAAIPNPNPPSVPVCGATAASFFRNCVFIQESENSTHNVTFRWNFHPAASFTIDYTNQEYDKLEGMPSDVSNKLVTMGIDLVF
ncbi:porin [Aestuariibacter sp. AA17]|uniref:Porin n=1 Tax=Fluctibacter corallii TaxID=2984329 RepID=A0ABT3ACA9_9ALTE|nr:porin [Aestuariibacter sp. AA17]MCV2886311.1 porin [Aestuariibacter sp. AA17]